MADGRKNEEIKVIKNPLLRQNLLLEEISGISFVVPPVSEKLETVDNISKHLCNLCQKSYRYPQGLWHHQTYECGKDPQFQCSYCPYKAK